MTILVLELMWLIMMVLNQLDVNCKGGLTNVIFQYFLWFVILIMLMTSVICYLFYEILNRFIHRYETPVNRYLFLYIFIPISLLITLCILTMVIKVVRMY